MADPETDRVLHLVLLPELVAIGVAVAVLAYSLVADTTLLSSYPRTLRVTAAVVLSTDLIAPLAVWIDMRRRGNDVDAVWIHAAALPIVNIFGVAAYLQDRDRLGESGRN